MDSIESERNTPAGLGGWLILLLLAIWINAAARLAAGISAFAVILHFPAPVFPVALKPVPAAIAVVAGLFGAIAGYLLARKNRVGPAFTKTLLSLDIGYYLLFLLFVVVRTGPVAADTLPPWVKPGGFLFASSVALIYLLRSRRVANTYFPKPVLDNPADIFHNDENSELLRSRIFPWEETSSPDEAGEASEGGAVLGDALDSQPTSLVEHDQRAEDENHPSGATHQSRIFSRDQMFGPRPPVPLVQEEITHEPFTRIPVPQRVEASLREEAAAARALAREAKGPETHKSRIFSRDEMLGPDEPHAVPETSDPFSSRMSKPRRTDRELREEEWPIGPVAPEGAEPESYNGQPLADHRMAEFNEPGPMREQNGDAPGSTRSAPRGLHPELWEESWPVQPLVPEVPEPETQNGHPYPATRGLPPLEEQLRAPDSPERQFEELNPHQAEASLPMEGPNPDELDALKAQLAEAVARWLAETADGRGPRHTRLPLFDDAGQPLSVEEAQLRLLDQLNTICDQVWSVYTGQAPTLPNSPDSDGSLAGELQKWAIAQAAFRLTRSLDIRAAMEAYGNFDKVAQDHEYLMAVAQKNSSEDAFGRKVEMAEYDGYAGPEIAYRLILRAQRDMFEADLWAHVADLAGDPDSRTQFAGSGSNAFQESIEYWRDYATHRPGDRGAVIRH